MIWWLVAPVMFVVGALYARAVIRHNRNRDSQD